MISSRYSYFSSPPPFLAHQRRHLNFTERRVQHINRERFQRSKTTSANRLDMAAQALFGIGRQGGSKIADKKAELLQKIASVNRGLTATQEDKTQIEGLAKELEGLNKNKDPLSSPLVNGEWELLYTTSSSILGTSRPPFLRPQGSIYQLIDAENLKAANRETWPFYNQVSADLTPIAKNEVAVQFTYFKVLGLLPVKAPESAKGRLSVTFLDEELRISRGDRGNLFVLRMNDPTKRP